MAVQRNNGFTLLEVMLVIVVLGMMYSAVIPSIRGTDPSEELERHSQTFSEVFALASEYALLNNIELGLHVKDNRYQFLAFDGQRWQSVPDQQLFTEVVFAEPLALELQLDDLPIDDDALIVNDEMFAEFAYEQGFDDAQKPIYPHVYIFSSGEITPFKLDFIYDDNYLQPIYYQVSASYTLPVNVNGPLDYEKN